jgi:hypothetical protein
LGHLFFLKRPLVPLTWYLNVLLPKLDN